MRPTKSSQTAKPTAPTDLCAVLNLSGTLTCCACKSRRSVAEALHRSDWNCNPRILLAAHGALHGGNNPARLYLRQRICSDLDLTAVALLDADSVEHFTGRIGLSLGQR